MRNHNEQVTVAMRELWGREHPVTLSLADRKHHLYVVGQTGTGKTTLLKHLIRHDIEAGRGIGVIDPHGDLANEILDLIPKARADDLVYFDPADLEWPVGLNLLANVPRDARHVLSSAIVSALKSIWSSSWGPRLEHVLYAACAALLECQNTSLLGVYRILVDDRYRDWAVRQVKDPMTRAFWELEFTGYDKHFRSEVISPVLNKVGQLLMSPPIRNVLGQVRSKVSLRFMMDNRRLFIANLSKGRLGEDKSALLGALLVANFQTAALGRSSIPAAHREPFHLFVDEFQSFTSDSFAAILSEARKHGLHLTVAHQFIDQLRPEIRDAVFGNVASMIAFRVGDTDAKRLARTFGEVYPASVLAGLNNYDVCARMLSEGRRSDPFLARTVPLEVEQRSHREGLIRRSREKYAVARSVVEGKIDRWMHNTHRQFRPTRRKSQ